MVKIQQTFKSERHDVFTEESPNEDKRMQLLIR